MARKMKEMEKWRRKSDETFPNSNSECATGRKRVIMRVKCQHQYHLQCKFKTTTGIYLREDWGSGVVQYKFSVGRIAVEIKLIDVHLLKLNVVYNICCVVIQWLSYHSCSVV